jgi:hypothetical protein
MVFGQALEPSAEVLLVRSPRWPPLEDVVRGIRLSINDHVERHHERLVDAWLVLVPANDPIASFRPTRVVPAIVTAVQLELDPNGFPCLNVDCLAVRKASLNELDGHRARHVIQKTPEEHNDLLLVAGLPPQASRFHRPSPVSGMAG